MPARIALAVLLLSACSPRPATDTTAPQPAHTTATPRDAGTAPTQTAPTIAKGTTMKLPLKKPVLLLNGESTAELVSFTTEQIAENPDNPEAYPAGSGVTMEVTVGGDAVSLSELSEGYDSTKVGWTWYHRIELKSIDYKEPSITVELHELGELIKPALASGTIFRGARMRIDDELTLEFVSHSHKSVSAGMDSPLIVTVNHVIGGTAHEMTENLDTNALTWRFRDYLFMIKSYEYGASMTLDVFKLSLKPA